MKELELFFNNLRTRRENPEITIKNYSNTIEEFFKILNINNLEDIRNIKLSDIDNYKMELMQKKLKLSSIKTKLSRIKSFLDFLVEREYINKNVITKNVFPKVVKSYKKIPSREDFKAMIDNINLKTENGMKYYTMINLFISTGLRISELNSLQLKDFKEDVLYIKGKGSKERTIILQDNIINLLNKYIKSYRNKTFKKLSREEFNLKIEQNILQYKNFGSYENYLSKIEKNKNLIFKSKTGIAMADSNINEYLKKLAKKSGIDMENNDISAHILRHFYAIFNLENDVPLDVLQENMGHSDISTTRIYAETSLARRKEQSRKAYWSL